MLNSSFKRNVHAKQPGHRSSLFERIVITSSSIALAAVLSLHDGFYPSKTPEETLRDMGYDPQLISNMPKDTKIRVYNQRPFLKQFLFPSLKCGSFAKREKSSSKKHNTAVPGNIYLPEDKCLKTKLTTLDGKSFQKFNKDDWESWSLYILLHEWRHSANVNWNDKEKASSIKTDNPDIIDTEIHEIDSDIGSLPDFKILRHDSSIFLKKVPEIRAVTAFTPFFTNHEKRDLSHDSTLAIHNVNNITWNKTALHAINARTQKARTHLDHSLCSALNTPEKRAQSLKHFKSVLEETIQKRPWAATTTNQQEINDTDAYAHILLSGIRTLQKNEIKQAALNKPLETPPPNPACT
ncbi:MAG: hypothetical protein R3E13_07550 [Alphaproteobacteria bacterium]